MKISKHIHSCILIKDENGNILIDPGNYSYNEKALDLNSISTLDYLLLTHEHEDHVYMPFVKEIISKFPQVKILTNEAIRELLKKENIETSKSIEGIEMFQTSHEKVFGTEPPMNVGFNISSKFTHPGDSLSFDTTEEVLALPVQAPWCSLTEAVNKAETLKPKIIIPIHDWHWNDTAREAFYGRMKSYFATLQIDFRPLSTGEEITV